MRALGLLLGGMAIAGCGRSEAPSLLDTGWFDEATTATGCQDKLDRSSPESGVADWYWRDRPEISVTTTRPGRYQAWLVDENERRLPTTLEWNEAATEATLEWDGWLTPETDYTLFIKDCEQVHEVPFTTSDLGEPLDAVLGGRAYRLDLEGANWTEPGGIGALVALYLTEPILLQVDVVLADGIRFSGAPGILSGDTVRQDLDVSTWAFGLSDFSERPFFNTNADLVVLQYEVGAETVEIPIRDFVLQGTFSADGSRIGGGVLGGRADTRNLGASIAPGGNPARLCELAEGLGIDCIECDDGEPLCLDLVAKDLQGTLVPGLTLVAQ